MQERIRAELQHIEQQHHVTILFACEAGSRATGLSAADSDYDVRFIYVRPQQDYLVIDDGPRDVIEYPIDDQLDISGWDLRKALRLMRKSNPSFMEWLSSPIVYTQYERFMAKLRALIAHYYSPQTCFYHYRHMAAGNFRGYLQGEQVRAKKYLYVIRPLLVLQWLERYQTFPPLDFLALVETLVPVGPLRDDILMLIKAKQQGLNHEQLPAIDSIQQFITHQLSYYEQHTLNSPQPDTDNAPLNQLFRDVLCDPSLCVTHGVEG